VATPYVTVTDAAGRVLFRRPATQAEIEEAMQVADAADSEAEAGLKRIAAEREANLAALRAEERRTAAQPLPPHEERAAEDRVDETELPADTFGEVKAPAEAGEWPEQEVPAFNFDSLEAEPQREHSEFPAESGFPIAADHEVPFQP
jgi:hypothetical protein